MNNILNYETYLFISSKKLIITVNIDLEKKIYYEELLVDEFHKHQNFRKLDYFLNQNIFKIEKKFKNFIEKITIILDLDVFFPIEISVKKNNYNDFINLKSLNHLLYEAKESCKKTIEYKRIVHMIIENYQIDKKNYSFFPENIKCQSYSLDLKFICISNKQIEELERILKRYHISLNQVLSCNYLENFLSNDERDIFSIAKKMKDGFNPNEVILTNKTFKNEGFFEKFFNFFS